MKTTCKVLRVYLTSTAAKDRLTKISAWITIGGFLSPIVVNVYLLTINLEDFTITTTLQDRYKMNFLLHALSA
jgi:hypothetical protein